MSQTQEIQKHLTALIDKYGNGYYIPVGKLINLTSEVKKSLGGTSKTKGSEYLKLVQPYFEDEFIVSRGGNTRYLVKKLPIETIILETVKKNLDEKKTLGQLRLPFPKPDIAKTVNKLSQQGLIFVEVNDNYVIRRVIPIITSTQIISQPSVSNSHVSNQSQPHFQSFKSVYDRLIPGRQMVLIADLRRNLNWDEKEFDNVIEHLRGEGKIQLMTGDASLMREEDVRLGYKDANGFDYLILKWKNP